MQMIQVNGASLNVVVDGNGPETIVFVHGLLMTHRLWDAQVETFKHQYRCIRFDFRGQGRSEVTAGGYDMDTLAADTAALIEQLDAGPCHLVGLSMGGFVGLRLGFRRPELLRSLVLMDTSADPEAPGPRFKYALMAAAVRWVGYGPVYAGAEKVLFGHSFLRDPARAALRSEWRARITAQDRTGVARAANGVFSRDGVAERLGDIPVPTLVAVGEEDTATPPFRAERIAAGIPGARLAQIPSAGHSPPIENPGAVNEMLREFWKPRP